MLVDIIFFQVQRGEYNGSDSSFWVDLWVNFLGAAVGAALGLWAAWWLFQQQRKVDKQKNDQATEQTQNERLRLFKFLVENIRKAIGKQVTDLGKTAAAIREAPVNIHPLLIRYAIEENWELIKFNSADFFSAYQYYENQQEDYRKLIDLLSFYFALYQDLKEKNRRYVDNVYERQIRIKEATNRFADEMVRVLRDIELTYPDNYESYPQYEFHNKMLLVYRDVRGAGITELRDKLLKPYNETVVSQFKYDEYAHDMMITAKNIIFIISEIKLDAEQYAATFELIQKNLSESIGKLDHMIAQMKTSRPASTNSTST